MSSLLVLYPQPGSFATSLVHALTSSTTLAHAGLVAGPTPFYKACSRCGEAKRLSEFYSQGTGRGFRADCKLCYKKSRVVRPVGRGEAVGWTDDKTWSAEP